MRISADIVLEVTRQCNLRCDHCLRGEAQRLHMKNAVIDTLFDQVSVFKMITFSGGEPTLVPDKIIRFVQGVRKHLIEVYGFYLATNGREAPMSIVHALIDLFDWCEDEEACTLAMSHTQFHGENPTPKIYKALRFFNKTDKGPIDERYLRYEGRTKTNQMGDPTRIVTPDTLLWREEPEGYLDVFDGTLYIDVHGNVIPGCDFSYQRAKKFHMGNILQTPLDEIVRNSEYAEETDY